MIQFALIVMLCASAETCEWAHVGYYTSEQTCRQMGHTVLGNEEIAHRFKCVIEVRETVQWAR